MIFCCQVFVKGGGANSKLGIQPKQLPVLIEIPSTNKCLQTETNELVTAVSLPCVLCILVN